MPKRLLSSLTWKVGVAAGAFALAAGTGATTIHFVNASSADDTPAVTTTHADDTNEHATDGQQKADDAKADDSKADDDASEDTTATAGADSQDHPDNFGKTVSEDAKDGGVDGREIRDMAPGAAHRNSAATDAHKANADNTGDDANDKADDSTDKADDADEHATDGQQKADDADGDHGRTESDTDGSDD